MTFNPISLQVPQSSIWNLRSQLNNSGGEGSFVQTAIKIAALGVSIGSFVFLGPIAGVVTSLGCVSLFLLFNSCYANHSERPPIPWHHRVFNFFPTFTHFRSPRESHVRVGGGHIYPQFVDNNVPVGRGGGGAPRGGGGQHVQVGVGHPNNAQGGGGQGGDQHVQVGVGHPNNAQGGRGQGGDQHVQVGVGHPNNAQGGRGPHLPPQQPLSGPTGHILPGSGRRGR
jgi:hypothetical protein